MSRDERGAALRWAALRSVPPPCLTAKNFSMAYTLYPSVLMGPDLNVLGMTTVNPAAAYLSASSWWLMNLSGAERGRTGSKE